MKSAILQIIWKKFFKGNLKSDQEKHRCLTISSEVVVEDLEEREGVPGVLRLFRQDLVHIHSKQRPEELAVLHQEVTEPSEGLQTSSSVGQLGWGQF